METKARNGFVAGYEVTEVSLAPETADQIRAQSVWNVSFRTDDDGPEPFSIAQGPTEPGTSCRTCNAPYEQDVGHFAHFELGTHTFQNPILAQTLTNAHKALCPCCSARLVVTGSFTTAFDAACGLLGSIPRPHLFTDKCRETIRECVRNVVLYPNDLQPMDVDMTSSRMTDIMSVLKLTLEDLDCVCYPVDGKRRAEDPADEAEDVAEAEEDDEESADSETTPDQNIVSLLEMIDKNGKINTKKKSRLDVVRRDMTTISCCQLTRVACETFQQAWNATGGPCPVPNALPTRADLDRLALVQETFRHDKGPQDGEDANYWTRWSQQIYRVAALYDFFQNMMQITSNSLNQSMTQPAKVRRTPLSVAAQADSGRIMQRIELCAFAKASLATLLANVFETKAQSLSGFRWLERLVFAKYLADQNNYKACMTIHKRMLGYGIKVARREMAGIHDANRERTQLYREQAALGRDRMQSLRRIWNRDPGGPAQYVARQRRLGQELKRHDPKKPLSAEAEIAAAYLRAFTSSLPKKKKNETKLNIQGRWVDVVDTDEIKSVRTVTFASTPSQNEVLTASDSEDEPISRRRGRGRGRGRSTGVTEDEEEEEEQPVNSDEEDNEEEEEIVSTENEEDEEEEESDSDLFVDEAEAEAEMDSLLKEQAGEEEEADAEEAEPEEEGVMMDDSPPPRESRADMFRRAVHSIQYASTGRYIGNGQFVKRAPTDFEPFTLAVHYAGKMAPEFPKLSAFALLKQDVDIVKQAQKRRNGTLICSALAGGCGSIIPHFKALDKKGMDWAHSAPPSTGSPLFLTSLHATLDMTTYFGSQLMHMKSRRVNLSWMYVMTMGMSQKDSEYYSPTNVMHLSSYAMLAIPLAPPCMVHGFVSSTTGRKFPHDYTVNMAVILEILSKHHNYALRHEGEVGRTSRLGEFEESTAPDLFEYMMSATKIDIQNALSRILNTPQEIPYQHEEKRILCTEAMRQQNAKKEQTVSQHIRPLFSALGKKRGLVRSIDTKRCNMSGRLVQVMASHRLSVDQVGLPRSYLRRQFKRVRVTKSNLAVSQAELDRIHKSYVQHHAKAVHIARAKARGMPTRLFFDATLNEDLVFGEPYPAVRRLIRPGGTELFLPSLVGNDAAWKLAPGDEYEVNIQPGDKMMYERQPALRSCSLMALTIVEVTDWLLGGMTHDVIVPDLFIMISVCLTKPMNGDFDGDAGSLQHPPGDHAQIELACLMSAQKHALSAQNSAPLLEPVQDCLSTLTALTLNKNTWFKMFHVQQLVRAYVDLAEFGLPRTSIECSEQVMDWLRARLKWAEHEPVPKVISGHDIASLILPRTISFEASHLKVEQGRILPDFAITKPALVSSSTSLFKTICLSFGAQSSKNFLDNTLKLAAWFANTRGMGLTLLDLILPTYTHMFELDRLNAQAANDFERGMHEIHCQSQKTRDKLLAPYMSKHAHARWMESYITSPISRPFANHYVTIDECTLDRLKKDQELRQAKQDALLMQVSQEHAKRMEKLCLLNIQNVPGDVLEVDPTTGRAVGVKFQDPRVGRTLGVLAVSGARGDTRKFMDFFCIRLQTINGKLLRGRQSVYYPIDNSFYRITSLLEQHGFCTSGYGLGLDMAHASIHVGRSSAAEVGASSDSISDTGDAQRRITTALREMVVPQHLGVIKNTRGDVVAIDQTGSRGDFEQNVHHRWENYLATNVELQQRLQETWTEQCKWNKAHLMKSFDALPLTMPLKRPTDPVVLAIQPLIKAIMDGFRQAFCSKGAVGEAEQDKKARNEDFADMAWSFLRMYILRQIRKNMADWPMTSLQEQDPNPIIRSPCEMKSLVNDVKHLFSAFWESKAMKNLSSHKSRILRPRDIIFGRNMLWKSLVNEIPSFARSQMGLFFMWYIQNELSVHSILEVHRIYDTFTFGLLLDHVGQTFTRSRLETGYPIGLMTAAFLCEPNTQLSLNSKHNINVAGAIGVRTRGKDVKRTKELSKGTGDDHFLELLSRSKMDERAVFMLKNVTFMDVTQHILAVRYASEQKRLVEEGFFRFAVDDTKDSASTKRIGRNTCGTFAARIAVDTEQCAKVSVDPFQLLSQLRSCLPTMFILEGWICVKEEDKKTPIPRDINGRQELPILRIPYKDKTTLTGFDVDLVIIIRWICAKTEVSGSSSTLRQPAKRETKMTEEKRQEITLAELEQTMRNAIVNNHCYDPSLVTVKRHKPKSSDNEPAASSDLFGAGTAGGAGAKGKHRPRETRYVNEALWIYCLARVAWRHAVVGTGVQSVRLEGQNKIHIELGKSINVPHIIREIISFPSVENGKLCHPPTALCTLGSTVAKHVFSREYLEVLKGVVTPECTNLLGTRFVCNGYVNPFTRQGIEGNYEPFEFLGRASFEQNDANLKLAARSGAVDDVKSIAACLWMAKRPAIGSSFSTILPEEGHTCEEYAPSLNVTRVACPPCQKHAETDAKWCKVILSTWLNTTIEHNLTAQGIALRPTKFSDTPQLPVIKQIR